MDAEIRVAMAGSREAEIIRRAMSIDKKPGKRSSLSLSREGDKLLLKIKASDLGALRASLNSSLRELKIADSVL